MDTAALMKSAVPLALVYGIAHFVKNPMIKAAAYGVIGTIIAKQIPFINEALA